MSRKKTTVASNSGVDLQKADAELTGKLNQAFNMIVNQQFGSLIAPPPITTKFNIEPLDTLLGGGLVSSAPIRFSSTPETGKSTIAFQFSNQFLCQYQNGVVAYIDIEGAGNTSEEAKYRLNRIETFNIDQSRFQYLPMVMNLTQVFNMIEQFCEIKKQVEISQQKEFYVAIIWDSIAATPSSKISEVDQHDSMIGHKARQLTFLLDKFSPLLSFHKITFITIDQVRANIKIEGPYAQKEKTVGTFKDYKAASSIASLDHRTSQWLFLSKKKEITLADGFGIDGWFMGIYTEKNKHAPSKIEIEVVFDKAKGIDKFWTEFHFLNNLIPTESKLYKTKKPPFPLLINQKGNQYYLMLPDPSTGQELYNSGNFFKKDAKNKYVNDEEFKKYFDAAVQMSVYYRIIDGLFRYNNTDSIINESTEFDESDNTNNEFDENELISQDTMDDDTENEDQSYITLM